MIYLRFFLLIIAFFFPVMSFSQEKLPDYSGWVNDFAGVISPEFKARMTALINEVEAKTTAEIFVVTVSSIAPYSESQYTQMLFDQWKIGKKGKDNGVLVLLAVQDRRWRIQTGYGVEGILPDGLCNQIGRDHIVPYFKEGKYDEGLYYGIASISDVIARDAGISLNNLTSVNLKVIPQNIHVHKPVPVMLYFFAFFFFLVWNIPWPIFIGLPMTIIFGAVFSSSSPILGFLVAGGYLGSILLRHSIWSNLPQENRKSFWHDFVWGLPNSGTGGPSGFSSGGYSGGSSGGGGGFSSGGGSSGGGGAGGGF